MKKLIPMLFIFAPVLVFSLSSCSKPPSREQCGEEMKKVQDWQKSNPDKAKEIADKHKDLDKYFQEGDFNKLKAPMTEMYRELLVAAGGNKSCAAVLADMNIENVKKMSKTFGGGNNPGSPGK